MSEERARELLKEITNGRKKAANRRPALQELQNLCASDRTLLARLTLPPARPLPDDDGVDDDDRLLRSFFWSVDEMAAAVRGGESTLLARVAPWCSVHARLSPERGRTLRDALCERCSDPTVVRGGRESCGNIALARFCDVVAAGVVCHDFTQGEVAGLLLPALLQAGRRGELVESGGYSSAAVVLGVPVATVLMPVLADEKRSDDDRLSAWFGLSLGAWGHNIDVDVVAQLALHEQTPAALRSLMAAWCIERASRHALALQRAKLVETVDVPENPYQLFGGNIDTLVRRVRIDDVVDVVVAGAADNPTGHNDPQRRRLETALTLAAKLVERIPSLFSLLSPLVLARLDDSNPSTRGRVIAALHAGVKQQGAAVDAAFVDCLIEALPLAARRGALTGIASVLVLVPGVVPRVHAAVRSFLSAAGADVVDVLGALLALSPALQPDDTAAVVAVAVAVDDVTRRRLVAWLLWRSPALARALIVADDRCFPPVEDVHGYHYEERGRLEGLHAAPTLCQSLAASIDDEATVLRWLRSEEFAQAAAMASAAGTWTKAHPAARAAIVDELVRFLARPERHSGLVEQRQREEFSAAVAGMAIVEALFAPADFEVCERVLNDVGVAIGVRLDVLQRTLELSDADPTQRRGRAVVVAFALTLVTCEAPVASAVVSRIPYLLGRRFSDVEPLLELWADVLVLRNDVDDYIRGASVAGVRKSNAPEVRTLADGALVVLRERALSDEGLHGILKLNQLMA
ncbi:MAG: hypothetical protein Q8O67_03265 [Deltaproteobacteria bacterium]|nr:hypothetical protein [Deltaproteobacteria bacterium]